MKIYKRLSFALALIMALVAILPMSAFATDADATISPLPPTSAIADALAIEEISVHEPENQTSSSMLTFKIRVGSHHGNISWVRLDNFDGTNTSNGWTKGDTITLTIPTPPGNGRIYSIKVRYHTGIDSITQGTLIETNIWVDSGTGTVWI